MNKTALIAFANADDAKKVSLLAEECGLEVVKSVSSVNDIYTAYCLFETDYIFLSAHLPFLTGDGIHFEILKLCKYKRPRILYFVSPYANDLMKSAYSPAITMPESASSLMEALCKISAPEVRTEDIHKAEEILIRMGFSDAPSRKHLAYACAVCADNMLSARKLTSVIYPSVAHAFGISSTKAADGMRRLVDKAFLSGNIDFQYEIFQNTIDETRGKPTVSQLIALVGEMVRRGYEK